MKSAMIILTVMAAMLVAGGCEMRANEQPVREEWGAARAVMVKRDIRGRGVTNAAVLAAM